MAINAECHTDDYAIQIEFDATAWFVQAGIEEIKALAACQWGGDYAADAVADFFSDGVTADMFAYITLRQKYESRRNQAVGSDCHIDEASALEWLCANRPDVAFAIAQEEI